MHSTRRFGTNRLVNSIGLDFEARVHEISASESCVLGPGQLRKHLAERHVNRRPRQDQFVVHNPHKPPVLVSICNAPFRVDNPYALNAKSFEIRQFLNRRAEAVLHVKNFGA